MASIAEQLDELTKEIDEDAEALAQLIIDTRKKQKIARNQGDDETADRLRDKLADQGYQYAILTECKLKAIDNSAIIADAIKQFKDVKDKMDKAIANVAELKKFADAVTTISGILDQLITKFLVAA